jgi:hypothetical protein
MCAVIRTQPATQLHWAGWGVHPIKAQPGVKILAGTYAAAGSSDTL